MRFEYLLSLLFVFGPPCAGFLLGLVWAYLQSDRNQEGPLMSVLTIFAGGVACGIVGFFVTAMLILLFAGRVFQLP